MHLFYTQNILPPLHELGEEESRHCVKVLRLGRGDRINLADGSGTMYTAEITDANPAHCRVKIIDSVANWGRRGYGLTMAVAPTKNIDRYEWFIEKATEVGCDRFIPMECTHSERRVVKRDRLTKVAVSAAKQSLKAYLPAIDEMTPFNQVVAMPFDGVKLIAHCIDDLPHKLLRDCVDAGDNVLALIGPEGDFSPEEVALATAHGFIPLSLGDSRLRTETAALATVMGVAFINT
jgi:16S rRNA (uracil1498-N3)-methyltransferase